MAYISKRDAQINTDGPDSKTDNRQIPGAYLPEDNYEDDLDGEEDMEGEEEVFRVSLNREFPLSGGETDEDA